MEKLTSFFLTFVLFKSLYIHVQGEIDNIQDLKNFLKEELRNVKESEKHLSDKIGVLEKENEDLRNDINMLKKERELDQRMRRQSRNHVAFTAYHAQHVHSITKSQPIVYDHVLLNDGNAFSSTTGVFTAPVSGVYLFSYSVGSKAVPNVPLSQYDVFTRLVVNGVHQVSAVAESTATDDDEQGSTTAILFVLEGDQVWVTLEMRGAVNLYSSDFERITSFTGTLLYEKQATSGIIGK